jgi:hypothetical protein
LEDLEKRGLDSAKVILGSMGGRNITFLKGTCQRRGPSLDTESPLNVTLCSTHLSRK